ncbi:MAG: Fe-S cluster assembly scaffold protein NifU [Proteobacteria bacterium]|nr:Fe-S cluster assembly scaffold protein NifU [Pseudomonadota bacterium]
MYSETVLEHFRNPRNIGEIKDPDGVGSVGNPVCGDLMEVYIKVKDSRIEDIKFKTFGCGAAIAVSSMITEMAKGKTLDEAMTITNKAVAHALGGLPKNKLHCSNLGADALHSAIADYYERREGKVPERVKSKVRHVEELEACYCPYCDIELPEETPFCSGCGREITEEMG